MGDPAGIGPEIVVKAVREFEHAELVGWGSPYVMEEAVRRRASIHI
jgi:4-hydroxy-L-threonine phosphate dehydrogenase PdxA